MSRPGIYYITVDCDCGSLRYYVGKALDLDKRQKSHFRDLKAGRHVNRFLQRAWDKYGEAAFTFCVIEQCKTENLIEREQAHLDSIRELYGDDSVFNILKECVDTRLGVLHTEETRERFKLKWTDPEIREARISGQRATKATIESRARRSAAAKNANARPEAKERRRASQSDPENKVAHAAATKAALADPEVKARHRAGVQRAQNDPELKKRLHDIIWGDPEKRQRRAAAIKAGMAKIIITPEVRAQKRAAARARWDRLKNSVDQTDDGQ